MRRLGSQEALSLGKLSLAVRCNPEIKIQRQSLCKLQLDGLAGRELWKLQGCPQRDPARTWKFAYLSSPPAQWGRNRDASCFGKTLDYEVTLFLMLSVTIVVTTRSAPA